MTSKTTDLIKLLKSKDFRYLWLGQALSQIGDKIMTVMLPLIIYSMTGSAVTMGVVLALMMIPRVIFLPISGVLADHFPRRKLMVVADIVRLLLLTGLIIVNNLGILNNTAIYIYAIISGLMVALFQPAYSALKAQIFIPEIRNQAISLSRVTSETITLLGPSLGAFIISFTSINVGFIIDAVTFLISVITLICIKTENPITKKFEVNLKSFGLQLFEGYKEVRKHNYITATIMTFGFVNVFISGFFSVLFPWLINIHLNMPPYNYGLLISANGVGGILFATIFGVKSKWRKRGILTYLTIALIAVDMVLLSITKSFLLLLLLMVMLGGIVMVLSLIWENTLQELIPAEAFGRVSSFDEVGSYILLPIGYIFIGFASEKIGGINSIIIVSILALITGIIPLLIPSIRKFD